MARQGMVCFSVDSHDGISTRIDQRTVDLILGLSSTPLLVRTPLTADPATGRLDEDAYRAVFKLLHANQLPVGLVLHNGLEVRHSLGTSLAMQRSMSPNAPLGTGPNNRFVNDYIERFSLSAASFLQRMGDDAPTTVWIGNEPNLDTSSLVPGANCPAGAGAYKPSSLAPEVFGALLYTTATRIRAMAPQVTDIYPGSLSYLVKFHTDPKGPYIGDYISKALGYLKRYGAQAPYPFSGISLNAEGVLTEAEAAYIGMALTDIKTKYGLSGPNVLGEWGWAGKPDPAKLAATYAALGGHFALMPFFQLYTMAPHDLSSYGASTWTIQAGPDGAPYFVPVAPTLWYAALKKVYGGGADSAPPLTPASEATP